mgnify:CR=1 FL=1
MLHKEKLAKAPRAEAKKRRSPDCGCKRAGIGVFNGTEIQRCDDCDLFDTDEYAVEAVDALLLLLGKEYRRGGGTVADALDRLCEMQSTIVLKKGHT